MPTDRPTLLPTTTVTVAVYLAAIVAANLTVVWFGPTWSIANAFLWIGLDLTLRDRLHEAWRGNRLAWKMAGLIAAGGVLSWLLNRDAGQIAVASVAAFTVAAVVDTVVYQWLGHRRFVVRANGSNVFSALADSVVFPTVAFGGFLPLIVLGQWVAKVAGGAVWVWAIEKWRRNP